MSNNPNYTGLQTFTVPIGNIDTLIKGDFTTPKIFNVNMNGISPRQNLANAANVVRDYIRPKPENLLISNFLPVYNAPEKVKFDLDTKPKRRSQDKELR